MADSSDQKDIVRFTHGRKCPICGGSDGDPRHQGVRCHGFQAGDWVHCSREEHAGSARFYQDSQTYAHKARGRCLCGVEHEPEEKPARRRIDKVYKYRDANGEVVFEAVRYRPKGFSQRRPGPGGQYVHNLKGVELVPYQLDFLVHAPIEVPVWIVEGEKDADRLNEAGRLATCNPMGAGKWRDSYSRHLNGRTCLIIPDNDQVGREHARSVARSLQKEAASIRIVELPGLGEHGDLSDWLDAGGTLEGLAKLAEAAPELIAADLMPAPAPDKAEERPQGGSGGGRLPSQADLLMEIAERATLWRNESGEGFATIAGKNGTMENVPVNSTKLLEWLMYSYWTEHKQIPAAESLNSARSILSARSRFDGPSERSWLRVAELKEGGRAAWFLDLADEEGHAVRITADGWEVVKNPPVKFVRPDGMQPLPTPQPGGKLDDLWEFINIEPSERLLLTAVLTSMVRPHGPYPILVLSGEQGCAKSTTTRALKRLFDPRKPILGSLPETPLDLWVVATSNWLLSFDNISSINKTMSNALCQLALEGGMERRKLHTDAEVTILEAMRPMILNGIDDFARAPDLVDRVVLLNCPVIPETGRRLEQEFWARFHQLHPALLGAVCDAIAGGLALLPGVKLERMPRMAELATWGEAVCRHLGHGEGAFLDALFANRNASSAGALEDSPVAQALFELGRKTPLGRWEGTMLELLDQLREQVRVTDHSGAAWPRSARALSSHLRRIAQPLRRAGVEVVDLGRTDRGRNVAVEWCGAHDPASPAKPDSRPSGPSGTENPPYPGWTQNQYGAWVPY